MQQEAGRAGDTFLRTQPFGRLRGDSASPGRHCPSRAFLRLTALLGLREPRLQAFVNGGLLNRLSP